MAKAADRYKRRTKRTKVYGKTIENVKKHRNTKLVANNRSKSRLVSEPNYYTTK